MMKKIYNQKVVSSFKASAPVESQTFFYKGFSSANKQENFFDAGIIDPTKVVRSALENAASVAGTILLTDACVYSEKEEGESDDQGFGGMGGMM